MNGHDYTEHLAEEGLKSTLNDLDADGSGRNLLDGLMYRSRIARKLKWTVSFNRLSASTLAAIEADMNRQYVTVTTLDPMTGSQVTKTYYCSEINEGVQRWINTKRPSLNGTLTGETVYDGVTFNLIER